jgi:hypothetical protein
VVCYVPPFFLDRRGWWCTWGRQAILAGELLRLVAAYEMSDLPALVAAPLPADVAVRSYLDAVAWSTQILDQVDPE